MKENEDYNITVELKHNSKQKTASDLVSVYNFSGAKFQGIDYSAGIGANKTATMNFTTYMDLSSNRSQGLFVSGKISTALGDVVTDNGDSVIDNNSNNLISMPVYPQY